MSQQNKAWIRNSIAVADLMPLWHLIAMQMRFKEVIPLAVALAPVSTWYSLAQLTKHSLLRWPRCLTLCWLWTCYLSLLSSTAPSLVDVCILGTSLLLCSGLLRLWVPQETQYSCLQDTLVCMPRQYWESSFVMFPLLSQVFLSLLNTIHLDRCFIHLHLWQVLTNIP